VFEFAESISITATRSEIWRRMVNIEQWWPPSNPEHTSIGVRPAGAHIQAGTEIVFEERVAGIKGRAAGSITKWIPESEATWEGDAVYRYFGIPLRVQEGVSWLIEGSDEASTLSAHVWARFPSSVFGRLLEWYAKTFLSVVERDRQHARRELEYLKSII
jgi:hypothetical protein